MPPLSFVCKVLLLISWLFFDAIVFLVSYQELGENNGSGLKILRPLGRAGSTPAVRTNARECESRRGLQLAS